MTSGDVTKSLEVWVLQNLVNASIALGILAIGLAVVQDYYKALEKHLSLRVSIELWRIFTVVIVDICLVITVLVGLLVLNPDIMSDIKIAIPFYPIATILFAVALVLRLCRGGHEVGSRAYFRSFRAMLCANILNVVGFSMVMEAPGHEFLERYPSPFWEYIKTHLRSNADPCGIDFAQQVFYVCLPCLLLVLAWGLFSAVSQIRRAGDR